MERREELGQVWTPDEMVRWICDQPELGGANLLDQHVLEPGFGGGAFLRELIRRTWAEAETRVNYSPVETGRLIDEHLHGVEVDEARFDATCEAIRKEVLAATGVYLELPNLRNESFLDYQAPVPMDLVVGNPPYLRPHDLSLDVREAIKREPHTGGTSDLYIYFYVKSLSLLSSGGMLSFIAPNSWLKNTSQASFRSWLLDEQLIVSVSDFGGLQVFPDVSTYVCIATLRSPNRPTGRTVAAGDFISRRAVSLAPLTFEERAVAFADATQLGLAPALAGMGPAAGGDTLTLGDVAETGNGVATLADKVFLVPEDFPAVESDFLRPVVKGSRYVGGPINSRIIFPYVREGDGYRPAREEELREDAAVYEHLSGRRAQLDARAADAKALWFHYGRSQAISRVPRRKLVISPTLGPEQEVARCAIVPEETVVYSGLYICEKEPSWPLELLQDIVTSSEFRDYIRLLGKDMRGGYRSFGAPLLRSFAIPARFLS